LVYPRLGSAAHRSRHHHPHPRPVDQVLDVADIVVSRITTSSCRPPEPLPSPTPDTKDPSSTVATARLLSLDNVQYIQYSCDLVMARPW
jgi:hypothetical protein